MTLADARALEPAIRPVDADFTADARALDGLADWSGRYTPWVGLDAPDGIFLDITGCGHLFGGETALLEDVAVRLDGFGYGTRAAIADTPGAAWGMARHGAERRAIVRPGHGRQALAGLPVEGLRLPAEIATGLRRVGMRRIGDLYAMPRAGITARFGVIVTRCLDLALAISPEPISPRRPVPPHIARVAFAEPISTPENLTVATRHLLDELCAGMERAGQGARRLDLGFFRVDGRVERSSIGTSRPVRAPLHLARLFAERLDRVEPGPGIEIMILAATTEPLGVAQIAMRIGAPALFGGEREDEAELVDRLGNRFGLPRVRRLLPRESWWPENNIEVAAALDRPDQGSSQPASWPSDRFRPVRLLPRPEFDPCHGSGAGRSTADVPLARYPAQGRSRRRTGTAGAGMVARTDRNAGLLPCRGRSRPTLLGLPRRSVPPGSRGALVSARGVSVTAPTAPVAGPVYAELQVATNFTFLRGASHAEELALSAAALGHAAIAVTDRNSLAGIVRAHVAAKSGGIRLVVGCRLDLSDGPSLLCLPTDRRAYGRLVAAAHRGSPPRAQGPVRANPRRPVRA